MDVLRTLLASRARAARSTEGSMLIEVIVSAALLVVVVVGIFAAIDGSQRGSARIKERGVAASLAQQDQDRLRGRSVAELNTLNETRAVLDGGVTYTVTSTAQLLGDSTGTGPCASTSGDADYLQISSTVTWPNMGAVSPVTNLSLVAPPPGNGSIRVSVTGATGAGVAGVSVTLTGPSPQTTTSTGTTDAAGCFFRTALPLGDYTVSLSKTSPSQYVDRQGNPSPSQDVSAISGAVTNVAFDYDRAGSITANLTTKVGAATLVAYWNGIGLTNSAMPATKYVVAPGNPPAYVSQISASGLFPVAKPDGYGVFAGSCDANSPLAQKPPQPLTIASVNGPAVNVAEPALNLKVVTDDKNNPVATGATVNINTETAGCPNTTFKGLAINANGALPNPGLPYGVYDVCAQLTTGGETYAVAVNNVVLDKQAGTPTLQLVIPVKKKSLGVCL